MFGFQIGSGDDFFLIGVGLCLFVFVVVFVDCARGRGSLRKNKRLESPGNEIRPRQIG